MRSKIFALFVLFSAVCLLVYAHRPTDIEITPDFKSNSLKVEVTHPAYDRHKHYVDKVSITVDDEKPIIKYFFFQTGNKRIFTVQIPDLNKAKKIVVNARCKHGGSLKKEFNMSDFKHTSKK